jgi:EAL domain-containing protein (putative c-di-GMP-specific phosphodiesterase class I)
MLKIDRAFVAELGRGDARQPRTHVVAAILALARALGLQVVAEGIETAEELQALRELGCDYGQGYLLGRPAPARTGCSARRRE